ncbi:MAG: hypothetical protein MUF41_03805 [Sphingopyxis sp.]|jgi:hypothetical protein|nr:hypothetical protein [Sphingopyxis sp.]
MLDITDIPDFAAAPAAFGALVSPLQATGGSVFDIVIAVIILDDGSGIA